MSTSKNVAKYMARALWGVLLGILFIFGGMAMNGEWEAIRSTISSLLIATGLVLSVASFAAALAFFYLTLED